MLQNRINQKLSLRDLHKISRQNIILRSQMPFNLSNKKRNCHKKGKRNIFRFLEENEIVPILNSEARNKSGRHKAVKKENAKIMKIKD